VLQLARKSKSDKDNAKIQEMIMQQLIGAFLPVTTYRLKRKTLKGEIGMMFGKRILVR
jgi:hypothetical protein